MNKWKPSPPTYKPNANSQGWNISQNFEKYSSLLFFGTFFIFIKGKWKHFWSFFIVLGKMLPKPKCARSKRIMRFEKCCIIFRSGKRAGCEHSGWNFRNNFAINVAKQEQKIKWEKVGISHKILWKIPTLILGLSTGCQRYQVWNLCFRLRWLFLPLPIRLSQWVDSVCYKMGGMRFPLAILRLFGRLGRGRWAFLLSFLNPMRGIFCKLWQLLQNLQTMGDHHVGLT